MKMQTEPVSTFPLWSDQIPIRNRKIRKKMSILYFGHIIYEKLPKNLDICDLSHEFERMTICDGKNQQIITNLV